MLPVFGTNYHVTSAPVHAKFSGSRLKTQLFSLSFCAACEVTCVIIGLVYRFCYQLSCGRRCIVATSTIPGTRTTRGWKRSRTISTTKTDLQSDSSICTLVIRFGG